MGFITFMSVIYAASKNNSAKGFEKRTLAHSLQLIPERLTPQSVRFFPVYLLAFGGAVKGGHASLAFLEVAK